MTIEQEICKNIASALEAVLNDVSIDGNWLPPKTGNPKGAEAVRPVSLYVRVGARSYDTYTARIAEIPATLEFRAAFASDPDLTRTVEAYEATVGLLEEWHADLAAVKRDLAVDGAFDPVGLRLGGNADFEPDDGEKDRTFTQTITLKGRIIR